MKELIKFTVPVFTEEYKILVVIGKVEELAIFVSRYCDGWDFDSALNIISHTRGNCWNTLPNKHPLITLDIDLPYELALATLPHEASHAIDYIIEHLGINDISGEIRGHTISAVIRVFLKKILKGRQLIIK